LKKNCYNYFPTTWKVVISTGYNYCNEKCPALKISGKVTWAYSGTLENFQGMHPYMGRITRSSLR